MLHGSRLAMPPSRLGLGIQTAAIALCAAMAGVVPSHAAPQTAFDNSLWIGTDNTSGRNVLNLDRSGALLRTVGPVECTGFAIDVNARPFT